MQNTNPKNINLIEIQNLSKKYPDGDSEIEVLQNINFSLQYGASASIIGQSGSGKTTLLQIICFMQGFNDGSYFFQGRSASYTETQKNQTLQNTLQNTIQNALQNDIAIIHQQHNLLKDFSIYENILIALKTTSPTEAQKQKIDEVLAFLQIDQKKHARFETLSGGQAQRASIARAICKSPKLLLLDEPTGNLDEETSKTVMESITEFCKKYNTAFILITHNNALTNYTQNVFEIKNKTLSLKK